MESIAFLPLARNTFDIPLAEEMAEAAHKALSEAGYSLQGSSKLLTDLDSVTQEAGRLAELIPC